MTLRMSFQGHKVVKEVTLFRFQKAYLTKKFPLCTACTLVYLCQLSLEVPEKEFKTCNMHETPISESFKALLRIKFQPLALHICETEIFLKA